MKTSRHAAFVAAAALLVGFSIASPAAALVDVTEMTVAEIEAGFASNTFTSVELTQSYLARIAEFEPTYNAFVSLNPEALSIAAALDLEYQTHRAAVAAAWRAGRRERQHGLRRIGHYERLCGLLVEDRRHRHCAVERLVRGRAAQGRRRR